jgi:hypothetical protein
VVSKDVALVVDQMTTWIARTEAEALFGDLSDLGNVETHFFFLI